MPYQAIPVQVAIRLERQAANQKVWRSLAIRVGGLVIAAWAGLGFAMLVCAV